MRVRRSSRKASPMGAAEPARTSVWLAALARLKALKRAIWRASDSMSTSSMATTAPGVAGKSVGDGAFEAPFGWCRANADRMPPLEEFVTIDHAQMNSVQKYHQAATLTWFLLEAKDRAYRPGFVKL